MGRKGYGKEDTGVRYLSFIKRNPIYNKDESLTSQTSWQRFAGTGLSFHQHPSWASSPHHGATETWVFQVWLGPSLLSCCGLDLSLNSSQRRLRWDCSKVNSKEAYKQLQDSHRQENILERWPKTGSAFPSEYVKPWFSLHFHIASLSPSELDSHRTKVLLPAFQFHFQHILRVSSVQLRYIILFSETCFHLHQMHRLLFKASCYPFLPNWSPSHLWCAHPVSLPYFSAWRLGITSLNHSVLQGQWSFSLFLNTHWDQPATLTSPSD